jgi:hypothetical protein
VLVLSVLAGQNGSGSIPNGRPQCWLETPGLHSLPTPVPTVFLCVTPLAYTCPVTGMQTAVAEWLTLRHSATEDQPVLLRKKVCCRWFNSECLAAESCVCLFLGGVCRWMLQPLCQAEPPHTVHAGGNTVCTMATVSPSRGCSARSITVSLLSHCFDCCAGVGPAFQLC